MKKYFFAAGLLFLNGCGYYNMIQSSKDKGYNFSLKEPAGSKNLSFSDDKISAKFTIDPLPFDNLSPYLRYSQIDIFLENLSNEQIVIDWNKISFVNTDGISGKAVMHKGVKFNECSNIKAPTVIPPNGKIKDAIIPCDALFLKDYTGWESSILPSSEIHPEIVFGFYMPLQLGDKTKNYQFAFYGKKEK